MRRGGPILLAKPHARAAVKPLLSNLGLLCTVATLIAVALAATALDESSAWWMTGIAIAAQLSAIALFLARSER